MVKTGKLLFGTIVILLGLTCNALAVTWTNAEPNGNEWEKPGNWNTGLPTFSDYVLIEGGVTGPFVVDDAVINNLDIGLNTAGASLSVNFAGFHVTNKIQIGINVGSSGVYKIYADGSSPDGWHTTDCAILEVGVNGSGTLINLGGTIKVWSQWFNVAANAGSGHVQLDGGTILCEELHIGSEGSIDIAGGTLRITGNHTSQIASLISSGQLTAYSGKGTVHYDYNTTNPGETTITATACVRPVGDINRDCVVSFNDIVAITGSWLADTRGPQFPLGLTVNAAGILQKDGVAYEGHGVNFMDAFYRTFMNGDNTSYDAMFEYLADHNIPFARMVGCGWWASENELYLTDKEEYFRRFDAVVASAEFHNVGLIPTLFNTHWAVPDLVGESCNQWGNPDSQTIAYMRNYVRDVVTRYRDSHAIWGWEFSGEWNLWADLQYPYNYPPISPGLGTPETRSSDDDLSHETMVYAISEFAKEVRKYDPHRMISSGHASPRPEAWHLWKYGTWVMDTAEQHAEIIALQNPDPVDVISVHYYPLIEVYNIGSFKSITDDLNKPLYLGEYGATEDTNKTSQQVQQEFNDVFDELENEGVPLSALWVFDYDPQEGTWNVSPTNSRSYQLDAVSQAN